VCGARSLDAAADHADATPKAERADYYDVGVQQSILEGLTIGLDALLGL